MIQPIEAGVTTTEFWVSTVAAGCALAFALASDFGWFHFTSQQQTDVTAAAVFVVGLIAVGYSIARGLRKRGLLG